MNEWKPDRSGKFLTVVYKDVVPGDEVGALHEHPKACAMSWSNALHDVDYLRNRVPQQRKPLTDEVLVPLKILEAAESSLGAFCSDEGWGDEDMQNMDNLSAYIAKHKVAHGIKEQDMTCKKYCASCQGAGQVDTGIMESPVTICNDCNGTGLAQQRTWVGLTDDEIVECWARPTMWATAHAIEVKLKEKNT